MSYKISYYKMPKSFCLVKWFPNYFNIFSRSLWLPSWCINKKYFAGFFEKRIAFFRNSSMFVATVHTTLPIRTASQGVSFAFIACHNVVALPLFNAHLATLFQNTNTRLA